MKIAFITLGCKLNFAETATYERGFRAAGLEVVPWREKADIYLINTCTVTETSNKKSRGEIRKVHRINPDARIIVVGCYAQLRPDDIRAIPGVSRVFTASEKDLVVPETISAVQVAVPGGTPFAYSLRMSETGSISSRPKGWLKSARKMMPRTARQMDSSRTRRTAWPFSSTNTWT